MKRKEGFCSKRSNAVVGCRLNEEGHSHSFCSQHSDGKSKRRRLGSNGSSITGNYGQDQVHGFRPRPHGKLHIRTILDELETYLAPSTPEIHRLRIPPAAGGIRRENPSVDDDIASYPKRDGRGNSSSVVEDIAVNPKPYRRDNSSSVDDDIALNPKPNRRENSSTVDDGSALNPKFCDDAVWEELHLSPDGLKEPRQDFLEEFKGLLEIKFGIMALRMRHGLDAWSLGSHMINPFEVLSYVAATSTLNRAFFKMWELIQTFQLVPPVSKNRRFLSAHLCEGPGGFIEAILEFRTRSSSISDKRKQEDISEEGHPDELRQSDSSSVSTGIKAQPTSGSDHPLPSELNDRIVEQIYVSTMLDNSGATSCPKTIESAEFGNEIGTYSKAGSESLPCATPESSGCDQLIGPMSMSGSSRATQLNDNGSTAIASAEVNELTERDLGRLDSRDAEEGSSGKAPVHYHDLWFGQTLATTQETATGGPPPPKLEMRRLNEKSGGGSSSQGHLHFGVDGSGDLTNPANMNAFVEYTLGQSNGQRMDLVTADGAFDVSEDFSSQEHSHLNLVFCEVVSALRLQAAGGSFVLKLFDCYTTSSLTILSLLSSLYRSVEIVRLRTTRVCNSERYVVAEGFLGLSPHLEKVLLRLNLEWRVASMRGEKVGLFFSGGFSERLLQAVMESNSAIAAVQVDAINRAVQLAELIGERLPTADSFGKRKGSISMLRRKLQSHTRMQRNAVALCTALNIPRKSQFCMEE